MAPKLTNLITRARMAKLSGVSAPAVTKACDTVLKPALVGKRIDMDHPSAIAYIEKNASQPTEDPLYNDAVKICVDSGEFTGKHLRSIFKIGNVRAKKIIELMRLNGIYKGSTAAERLKNGKVPKLKAIPKNKNSKKTDEVDDNQILLIPENIVEFIEWPLKKLIEKFGTDAQFLDWLKATQTIESINEKRIKNAQSSGELVSRELVKTAMIDPINSAHIKLLTDGAKTISRRVMAMTGAGKDPIEVEKYVKEQITSFIRPIKSKVKRILED